MSIDYLHPCHVVGSNGQVYRSKQNSGPGSTAQDPTTDSNRTYWQQLEYSIGLIGTPTAPTAAGAANTTQIANTSWVRARLTEFLATVRGGVGSVWSGHAPESSGKLIQLRAPLASPVFTGNPTVPTPPRTDADTSVPNTRWVADRIERLEPRTFTWISGTSNFVIPNGVTRVLFRVAGGGGGGGGQSGGGGSGGTSLVRRGGSNLITANGGSGGRAYTSNEQGYSRRSVTNWHSGGGSGQSGSVIVGGGGSGGEPSVAHERTAGPGGDGALAIGHIQTTPAETLTVVVGGGGSGGSPSTGLGGGGTGGPGHVTAEWTELT